MRMIGPSATVDAVRRGADRAHGDAARRRRPPQSRPQARREAEARHRPPQPKPALNARRDPAIPPTGFPKAIDKALAQARGRRRLARRPRRPSRRARGGRGQAGAKLGGAGFLALNVLNEDVAQALLTKLGTGRGSEPARPEALRRGRPRSWAGSSTARRSPRPPRTPRRERRPAAGSPRARALRPPCAQGRALGRRPARGRPRRLLRRRDRGLPRRQPERRSADPAAGPYTFAAPPRRRTSSPKRSRR